MVTVKMIMNKKLEEYNVAKKEPDQIKLASKKMNTLVQLVPILEKGLV